MNPVSMEKALEIKTRFEDNILKKTGVTGVDLGYRFVNGKHTDEVVIRVYVGDLHTAPEIPNEVEGVPVVVIKRRFELH